MDEDAAGGPAQTAGGTVERAYYSSEPVIAREVAALVRYQERRPGYWRPFVVRHAVAAACFLLAVGAVGLSLHAPAEALRSVLRSSAVLVLLLTGLDLVLVRRRLRRTVRLSVWHGCPPGTPVSASWGSRRVVFRLPSHEIRLDLTTVTAARHHDGVLLLEQEGTPSPWVVPDELLGTEALQLVREVVGPRYSVAG